MEGLDILEKEYDGIVYCYQHNDSGRYYVGCTTSKAFHERQRAHRKGNSGARHFNRAVKKHSIEEFSFRILEDGIPSRELLHDAERYWIKELNSYGGGFNITSGGEIGKEFQHTEEAKRKIAEASKGRRMSEEAKAKLSKAHTGKKLSQATIEKLRKVNTGRKNSPEVIAHFRLCRVNSLAVVCVETGESFPTTSMASDSVGLAPSNINHAVRNRTVAGGYHWMTKADYDAGVVFVPYENKKADRGVRVRCVETSTEYVSVSEAQRTLGITNVARSLKYGTTSGGYHWEYVDKTL